MFPLSVRGEWSCCVWIEVDLASGLFPLLFRDAPVRLPFLVPLGVATPIVLGPTVAEPDILRG